MIHRQFDEILVQMRKNGVEFAGVTTNGSLLKMKHLELVRDLGFRNFTFSVSIDSTDPAEHDAFRGHRRAFDKAKASLQMINSFGQPNIMCSIRSSIKPETIDKMEGLVKLAEEVGCRAIGFSAINPTGRAVENGNLIMNIEQKQRFLREIFRLNETMNINVTTNDPLKCLICRNGDVVGEDEIVLGGCGAGTTTFNIDVDGIMTPCAQLNVPMMNIFPMTVEEIEKGYRNSEIVKNLLDRNFGGKCSSCKLKHECGGCRVRAFASSGNYLAEDPHCWL